MSRNIFRCEACFKMESQCFNNLLWNKVRFTAWEKWTSYSCKWERSFICHGQGHSGMICIICCSQSIMQLTSTVTYSLIRGNSWNTSGPNIEHSQIFCGFLVTKSGAVHYLFIPHPFQRKVHICPHISCNTKHSSLPVNVKVYNTEKNVYLFHN